jgi:hypothetical protein
MPVAINPLILVWIKSGTLDIHSIMPTNHGKTIARPVTACLLFRYKIKTAWLAT